MNKTTWPTLLREDGVRVEILCPHGIGHPSEILSNSPKWKDWMNVHGCDGCCTSDMFYHTEASYLETKSTRKD